MKKNKFIFVILSIILVSSAIYARFEVRSIEEQYSDLFFHNLNISDEIYDYSNSLESAGLKYQLIYLTEIKIQIMFSAKMYSSNTIKDIDQNKYLLAFISSLEIYIWSLENEYISGNIEFLDLDKVSSDLIQVSHIIKDVSAENKFYANELHSIITERYKEFPGNGILEIYFRFLKGEHIKVDEFGLPYEE